MALQILQTYWGWITMVDKARGYYSPHFKGYRGVTEGDLLLPTIFNIVVKSVIHHQAMVVLVTEVGAEGLGVSVHKLAEYFLLDDGLVMLTQLERPKREFDVIADLFDRYIIWTNTRRTVRVACQPCHMPGSI